MPLEVVTNEAERIFQVDGVHYASVTEILQEMGFVETQWFTEQGALNGERRHLVRHLYDVDDLVENSTDDADQAYLDAWIELKKVTGITVIESEVRRYNHFYRYCGKPDCLVMFRGRKEVWDTKMTGSPFPWVKWQLGGYIGLYDDVFTGRCVYLQASGKFKLGDVYGRKEREEFLCIAKTYHMREEK